MTKHRQKEILLKILYSLVIIVCLILNILQFIKLEDSKIKYDKERYEKFNGSYVQINVSDKDKLNSMCETLSYGGKVDYFILNQSDYKNFDISQYGFNKKHGDVIAIIIGDDGSIDIEVSGRFSLRDENYLKGLIVTNGNNLYTNLIEILSSLNNGVHNINKHYYIDFGRICIVLTVISVLVFVLTIFDTGLTVSIKETEKNEGIRSKKTSKKKFKFRANS